MADYAHEYTDHEIVKLNKQIQNVYKEAEKDIQKKMDDFNAKYKAKEQKYQQKVNSGQMSQEDFDRWKKGQVFQGQQWQAKKEQILDTMHHSNEIATNMINDKTQNVFMTNANYMSYDMEHGAGINFGFGVYDSNTVSKLIKDDPQLLPKWKIDEPKDYKWSQKKLNNAITQGIIQGESLDKIAKRLSNKLASTNENKMKTFARTAMTGAQNSGRQMQLENAKKMGIDLMKEWMATLDSHTRDSHADVDGEQVEVDKKFSNGLMYPGEPGGAPAEVYNCRCTMVSEIKKYPSKYERYDNIAGKRIDNMSYEDWAKAKGMEKKLKSIEKYKAKKSTASNPVSTVVNGKDISQTWQRRSTEFAFEIEDVINAQGFDGLPQVVSSEEFERYVKESNFVAQRTYSAPDSETLKAYQNQLYNGKWYVDCSTGGAQYGQGMYCAGNYDGKLTNEIIQEMKDYQGQNLNYSGKQSVHMIETFTLDKSANIVTQEDITNSWIKEYLPTQKAEYLISLGVEKDNADIQDQAIKLMEEARKQEIIQQGLASNDWKASNILQDEIKNLKMDLGEERNYWLKKAEEAGIPTDIGSYAALKGYDAIRTSHGACGADTIILNRTKVIFKGE